MKLLKVKECRVGMRVKLEKPRSHYEIGENNPAVGSSYECEGTITGFEQKRSWVEVTWDNGYTNSYENDTLVLVGSPKNDTGFCISIWDEGKQEEE